MNRRTILITLIVLFIVLPVAFWGISAINRQSSTDTVIRDKDTGEVFDSRENAVQTGGSGVETGTGVLFGIEPLTDQLIKEKRSVSYVDSLKQALWDFNKQRADNKFKSITMRPQDLKITDTIITGSIRIDQTDTMLPISIQPSRTNAAAIVTINKDGSEYGGVFVFVGKLKSPQNLLFTITQKNSSSTDLVIQTYEGYREAALRYLESIGYNVPDFTIEFTNYENPF